MNVMAFHFILVMHFVWCGIEFTVVMVLVIIYKYFPIKSYTMAAPELFVVSAVGSCTSIQQLCSHCTGAKLLDLDLDSIALQ